MNTRISYLYRDASNYKQPQSVIISGELSKEQIDRIFEACDGEYFIPAQVGLPEERFDRITEDDHCWFEMGYIELTEHKPTEMVTAEEVFKNFMEAKEKGWDDVGYAPSIADNDEIGNEVPQISEDVLKDCLYELYKQSWLYENVPAGEQLDVLREYEVKKLFGDTSAKTFEDYLWENDGYHGALYVCKDEFLGAEYQDREFVEGLLTGGADREDIDTIMNSYDFYAGSEKEEIREER